MSEPTTTTPDDATSVDSKEFDATGIVTIFLKQPPAYEIMLDVPWTEKKFRAMLDDIADHARADEWYAFESVGPLVAAPLDNIALITFSR